MVSAPDVNDALEHYERLFPRQERLDLEAIATADVPAAGEAVARSPGPELPFTWTEAHRHACEVRYVQGLDPHAREAYLAAVATKRGAAVAHRLREDAVRSGG